MFSDALILIIGLLNLLTIVKVDDLKQPYIFIHIIDKVWSYNCFYIKYYS